MQSSNRKNFAIGLAAGIGITAFAGMLMGQAASQPVKSETQYFVTGEGDESHLWVREGAGLRCVGHGACTAHQHDEGHDHDHEKETPKK